MANLPAPPKAGQSNAAPKGPQKYYANINTGGPYPQTPVLTQQGFGMAPSIPTPPGGYQPTGGSIPMFGLGGGAPSPTGGRPDDQGVNQTFQYQTGVDPNTGLAVIESHPGSASPGGFLSQSQQADVAGAQQQQALQSALEDIAAQRMEAQRQQQLALRMAGMGGSGLAGGAWGQVGADYAKQAAEQRMQTGMAIEEAKNNAATNASNYWATKQTSHLAQHAGEMDDPSDVQINPALMRDMDELMTLIRHYGVSELAATSMIDDLFNQYQSMGLAHVYRKYGNEANDEGGVWKGEGSMMSGKQYYKTQSGEIYDMAGFDLGPTIDWS